MPATFTIPALTPPGDFNFINVFTVFIPFQTVAVNTPVTFTGTFNGSTQSVTATIPRTVDVVAISKAELVVKNGSLKVDATSTKAAAVLTLYNNATGQLIGTMTNNGLSGGGAKYSYQGTVSPVTTLRLQSSLNGTATGAVSQK